jgi:hypothetical protein
MGFDEEAADCLEISMHPDSRNGLNENENLSGRSIMSPDTSWLVFDPDSSGQELGVW